jgi:hypothetical protein
MNGYVHLARYHKVGINTNHRGWLCKEANLCPGHQEDSMLKTPMFWFTQYYPWVLRKHKDTFRLFTGHLANYKDCCEVRVHWKVVAGIPPRPAIYSHSDEQSETSNLKITADLRKHIKCHASFLEDFDINEMVLKVNHQVTLMRQNLHLLATAKVLARLSGRVVEHLLTDDNKIYQIDDTWSKFPLSEVVRYVRQVRLPSCSATKQLGRVVCYHSRSLDVS